MKDKTYLLHGLNKDILKMINEFEDNSTLTFDDGLRSVYKYKNDLKKIQEKKNFKIIILINPYFIIKSNKINKVSEKDYEFLTCTESHKNAIKNSNYINYMNCSDLNNLKKLFGKKIIFGLHSYDHQDLSIYKNYNRENYNYLLSIITECIDTLKENYCIENLIFDTKTLYFAWPFNNENDLFKRIFIKTFKCFYEIENFIFFGSERISGEWNYYEKENPKKILN